MVHRVIITIFISIIMIFTFLMIIGESIAQNTNQNIDNYVNTTNNLTNCALSGTKLEDCKNTTQSPKKNITINPNFLTNFYKN